MRNGWGGLVLLLFACNAVPARVEAPDHQSSEAPNEPSPATNRAERSGAGASQATAALDPGQLRPLEFVAAHYPDGPTAQLVVELRNPNPWDVECHVGLTVHTKNGEVRRTPANLRNEGAPLAPRPTYVATTLEPIDGEGGASIVEIASVSDVVIDDCRRPDVSADGVIPVLHVGTGFDHLRDNKPMGVVFFVAHGESGSGPRRACKISGWVDQGGVPEEMFYGELWRLDDGQTIVRAEIMAQDGARWLQGVDQSAIHWQPRMCRGDEGWPRARPYGTRLSTSGVSARMADLFEPPTMSCYFLAGVVDGGGRVVDIGLERKAFSSKERVTIALRKGTAEGRPFLLVFGCGASR